MPARIRHIPSTNDMDLIFFMPPVAIVNIISTSVPINTHQNAIKPLSGCIPPSDTRIYAADAQTAARSANKIPVPSRFKITVPAIMSAIAI